MSIGAKFLKANKVLDGKSCGWCSVPLVLGEDAAVCEACHAVHHAKCWGGNLGCSARGCLNAPLERLEEPAAKKPAGLPPGKMECPSCHKVISESSQVCAFCRAIVTPDGIYTGPLTNAPGAVAALVWGILSLLICGFILGFVAIVQASKASRAIASDPRLGGQGMATAGKVLGIIGICLHAIILLIRIGSR